jgi:fluoride exporter
MQINWQQLAAVATGGAFGACARFLFAAGISSWLQPAFPLATFLINMLGSFAIGVLSALFYANAALSEPLRLLLITGFLGAFTTFSTFSLEVWSLLQAGRFALASAYVISSVSVGVLAVWLGVVLAR